MCGLGPGSGSGSSGRGNGTLWRNAPRNWYNGEGRWEKGFRQRPLKRENHCPKPSHVRRHAIEWEVRERRIGRWMESTVGSRSPEAHRRLDAHHWGGGLEKTSKHATFPRDQIYSGIRSAVGLIMKKRVRRPLVRRPPDGARGDGSLGIDHPTRSCCYDGYGIEMLVKSKAATGGMGIQ